MLRAPLLLLLLLASADPPPLRERAEAFVEALNAGDVARINATMWSPQAATGRKRVSRLTLERVRAAISATREDAITIQIHDEQQRLVDEYEVRFVLEENEWRIASLLSTSAHLDPRTATPTLPLVRELLYRAAEAVEEGKLDEAKASYETAASLAGKLGHLGFQGTSERGLGNVAWARGDGPTSQRHFETSVELSRAAGDRSGLARSLLGLAQNDDTAGEYERAEMRLSEAFGIFTEMGNNLLAAYALNLMGNGRAARSDYKEAHRFYERALELAEKMGDVRLAAAALNNLGINLQVQGSLRESIVLFRRALETSRSIEAVSGMLSSYTNLGTSYMLQGNYADALQAYAESLVLSEKLGRAESTMLTLDKVGTIYRRLGDYEQARAHLEKALAIAEKSGAKAGLASAMQNLASVKLDSGDARGAIALFDKAIALNVELGNRANEARALESLGRAQLQQRDREAARKAFERSFAIAEEINEREVMASTLVRRASLANAVDAIALAERAVAIATELGLAEVEWQAHLGLGRALRRAQRHDEARAAIERAVTVVEELRREIPGEEMMRQQAFENMIEPYHELVALLVARRDAPAALEAAERAKARVLLDVLRYGRPDFDSALTAEERNAEAKIAAQLAAVNREHRKALVAGKMSAALAAKLRQARLESDRFITTLYAAHPQLRVESGEIAPITAAQLRARKEADAFVEFVVTEEATYRFTIVDGTVSVTTIPIAKRKLQDEVLRFRELLAERDLAYADVGRALYDRLFGGTKLKGTLCVVPDGPLWELPFQALQPAANEFLIDRHAMFLAPSLTVLREMSATPRSRAATRLLAFGFPNALAPLPQSETEVRSIAALYGAKNSRVYLRADAREEVVKAEAGSFDVLHFATHGVLDDRNALYSRLVFSPPAAKSEDGLLEAREIMRLDLRARLAVLSACETARGRVGEGEGLIGMSWALFVAGAPASVVSQWKVDSASTTELMIEFHRGLRVNGRSNAEALRRAALHVRAKYKHPFYWAPFVVIGH